MEDVLTARAWLTPHSPVWWRGWERGPRSGRRSHSPGLTNPPPDSPVWWRGWQRGPRSGRRSHSPGLTNPPTRLYDGGAGNTGPVVEDVLTTRAWLTPPLTRLYDGGAGNAGPVVEDVLTARAWLTPHSPVWWRGWERGPRSGRRSHSPGLTNPPTRLYDGGAGNAGPVVEDVLTARAWPTPPLTCMMAGLGRQALLWKTFSQPRPD